MERKMERRTKGTVAKKVERKHLLTSEVEKIFSTLDEQILQSSEEKHGSSNCLLRDRVIFALMYFLGLRLSEVLLLDVNSFSMIDATDGSHVPILRIAGLGGNRRCLEVPVYDEAIVGLLNAYQQEVRPYLAENAIQNKALFLSQQGNRVSLMQIHDRFNDTLDKAGLDGEGITSHSLRYAGICRQSMFVSLPQKIRGHRYAITTESYRHIPDEFIKRELAKAEKAKERKPSEGKVENEDQLEE